MNRKTSFLVLIYLFSTVLLLAQKNPVHVFITAGQSNTDGRVSNKLLPWYIKKLASDTIDFKEGAYKFCKISQNRNDGCFVPYFPKGRISEGYWTYDAVTYYLLEQALQKDFYVVKYAVGGTSIQYPNDTVKGRYWSANSEWLKNTTSFEKGGKSLLLSFTNAIDASIDHTLSKLDGGFQIDAFLWHQGESDDRYAGKYYENLKEMIKYVRNHLTEKTGKDYSRLPFVFGSIPESNRHYKPEIKAAMQRIANEDLNVYLIDMSTQELQKDRTHFNEKSAEYLGRGIYKTLDKILILNDSGFRVARYKKDKTCAISYTFDDGLAEHYSLVAPAMEKLGFRGTFWVNGRTIADTAYQRGFTRMTWKQMRKMANNGHEISSHGWTHRNVTKLSPEELRYELEHNDTVIFNNTGVFPRTFCYPGNAKNNATIAYAEENRIASRVKQFSVGGKSTRESLDECVVELLENHDWGVTMTHGITYGYDHFKDANILWEHLKKVKAQEDKIWVGTFREVAAYVKEQKAITYDIADTEKGFSVTPELALDKKLFTEPLTAVIEQNNIRKVVIRQGKKRLKAQIFPDKVLFDFNPFGGRIEVEIRKLYSHY
jgi:Predicted xylanase/chitin deacetylase